MSLTSYFQFNSAVNETQRLSTSLGADNNYPCPQSSLHTTFAHFTESPHRDGVDGEWSSFDLRVGTPAQTIRVLPSTAGSATWAVTPGGCEPPSTDCSDVRGGLFNQNQSSTWKDLGLFTLALEQNLGHNESGAYGLDTIALGLSDATGGPTLDSQIIAGIETEHWYTGVFGLQPQPMNLSDFFQPEQSFLSTLRARNLIPSLSWSYTAGAHYRSKGSFGSLIFGGSDTSKYTPTNLSFALAPDVGRDLVVGIQSITSTYVNGSISSLLPSPTLAYIDSTVPYLYLPEDACKAFESELGLVYNKKQNVYLVDVPLHQTLSNLKPQFTFRLANDKLSKPTIDIILPYAAFDLVMKPPLLSSATSYFPLWRGDDNKITLGRAFLQEAYIITDYDQKNFTVAQAVFDDIVKTNIVPIPWDVTGVPNSTRPLNRGATIGVSIGSTVFVVLIAVFFTFIVLKRRKYRALTASNKAAMPLEYSPEVKPISFIPTQEIGHQSVPELHNISYQELLDDQAPSGSGKNIAELPGRRDPSHRAVSASSNTWNSPNGAWLDRIAHVASTKGLPFNPGLRRATFTRPESSRSHGSTRPPTSGFAHSHLKINTNKTLPQLPLAKLQSIRNRSSDRVPSVNPVSEHVQTPPVARKARRRPSTTRKGTPVYVNHRTSQGSTYATIFDIGEYEDPIA
ncbi:MAG: hypothetical protein Q9224_003576 [Gallowayella concinna]